MKAKFALKITISCLWPLFCAPLGAEFSYGGTGCPQDSINIYYHNNNPIEAIFTMFIINADPYTNSLRKSCSIALPIAPQFGQQVSLEEVRLYGFHYLSDEAKAELNVEIFVAGDVGPIQTASFSNKRTFTRDFSSPEWTPCGKAAILRINMAAKLSNPSKHPASFQVEKMGGDKKLFKLKWRPCIMLSGL